MRFFLLVIATVVGVTYGYEYAIVLWIVGRIVVRVIAKGAESSARYQTYDSNNYRSNYQNSYQKSYQHNNASYRRSQETEYKSANYYYSVLGVSSNASDVEVKKAFRKQAMECHPDRYANSSEEVCKRANEKFQKVNEAVKKLRQMK